MIVTHPFTGCIRAYSPSLFIDPEERLDALLERVFHVPEVRSATVDPKQARVEILYSHAHGGGQRTFEGITKALEDASTAGSGEIAGMIALCRNACRKENLPLRLVRNGDVLSTWETRHELPGRVRLYHPVLSRKVPRAAVLSALQREAGVEGCEANSFASTVTVRFDPNLLAMSRLFQLLDSTVAGEPFQAAQESGGVRDAGAAAPEVRSAGDSFVGRDWKETLEEMTAAAPQNVDTEFAMSSTSLALAAAGQFAAPVFLPAGAFLLLAASFPSLREAYRQTFHKKRPGPEVLQTVFLSCCLATGEIFGGALMTWCGSLGRKLMEKVRTDSRKMLESTPGEAVGTVRIFRDGAAREVPVSALGRGETIVVASGEVFPADGIVSEGFGVVDQHALTGETGPVKKSAGDRVYASTSMIAGTLYVLADKVGEETARARVTRTMTEVLEQKPDERSAAMVFSDRAVVPTLGLGAIAAGTVGFGGAMAVMSCDLGTGVRAAEPIALQTYLGVCAHRGILVKDRRALETMVGVDTVLLDRSVLTAGAWNVARIYRCGPHDANRLMQLAAGVERNFSDPVALAIRKRFLASKLPMPPAGAAEVHVGLGVAGEVDGRFVRVGGERFMSREGIAVPEGLRPHLERTRREGYKAILVSVDDALGGFMELRPSVPPGLDDFVRDLRGRGIRHVAIVSNDTDAATQKMARAAGADRWFSGVLPRHKTKCVEMLQSEGRKVCFAGDGLVDSAALRRADLSVSLGGPSGVEADAAQVIFLHGHIGGLCDLIDIAREMDGNFRRSRQLIVIPNALCAVGVFTLGFGLWHAVIFNAMTTMLSVFNGMLPMRGLAEARADRAVEREMSLVRAVRGDAPLRGAKAPG